MEYAYATFPKELEKFNNVQNKEELILLLKSQLQLFSQEYQHTLNISYRVRALKNGKYLSARCRNCTANLNYVLNEETNRCILTKMSCAHRHREKSNLQEIKKHLKGIQTSNLSNFRKTIRKRLQISDSTFYKAKKQVQSDDRKLNFPELVDSLLAENADLKYDAVVVDLPETFIVITPEMKRLYQQFGKCLYIDFISNCIRDRPNFEYDKEIAIFNKQQHGEVKKSRQFILGILTGLSSAHKIVVFAYCFVLSESAEDVSAFLRSFFESQTQNITETIISDGGTGKVSAIKQLQQIGCFKGHHLRDGYHILKNIKLKQFEDFKKLSELSHARMIEEYNQILKEIRSTLFQKKEIQELERVQQLSPLFCFSKIPSTFVHLGSLSSFCEKTNDLIKQRIKQPEPYCLVAIKLKKLFTSANAECMVTSRQTINFEDILGIKQLKQCRERLPQPILKQILNQIGKSISLIVIDDSCQPNAEQFVCFSKQGGQKYRVSLQDQKLRCSCAYSIKTGLLCRHEICYLNSHNLPYTHFIDEFYKSEYVFKQPKVEEQKKRKKGRGKNQQ